MMSAADRDLRGVWAGEAGRFTDIVRSAGCCASRMRVWKSAAYAAKVLVCAGINLDLVAHIEE